MRAFTESEQAILHVVEQFDRVEKYQGITPEEHLVSFQEKAMDRLLDEEVLEKASLKSFSQKIKGVRFTRQGLELWRLFTGRALPGPVLTEAGLLVRDVYLRNKLSYSEEATSRGQILKRHGRHALVEAFEAGLLAKVKIRQRRGEVVKGYVVTSAGFAWLRGNRLI